MVDSHENTVLLDFSFEARAANLREMRHALALALEQTESNPLVTGDIVLATDEACQNIIRHAYGGDSNGLINITVRWEDHTLTLLVRDFAAPVNVDMIKPRKLDDVRPGGLGTHFMRELMDEVEITPLESGRGNLLRMTKKLD